MEGKADDSTFRIEDFINSDKKLKEINQELKELLLKNDTNLKLSLDYETENLINLALSVKGLETQIIFLFNIITPYRTKTKVLLFII